jgi:hypothetical protein
MDLPPCHSRRSLAPESRVYFCAHPDHHSRDGLVTAEMCRICPLWKEVPPVQFRKFPPDPPPKPRGRCLYLGAAVGWRECPSCRGSVRIKVFACSHPRHRETTLAECAECPDHEPSPDPRGEPPGRVGAETGCV